MNPVDENDGNFAPGHLSLREAVAVANIFPDTTITFDGSLIGQTITLTMGELDLNNTVGTTTIMGPPEIFDTARHQSGHLRPVIISGGGAFLPGGVFNIGYATPTVDISGITISNGYVYGSGGGIHNDCTTLSVTDCTFFQNSTTNYGGGVYNDYSGTATLTNDTLSGNSATYDGGGIDNHGTLTAVNTTIAYHAAYADGTGSIVKWEVSPHSITRSSPSTRTKATTPSRAGLLRHRRRTGLPGQRRRQPLIGTGGSGGLVNGANGNKVGVANPGLGPHWPITAVRRRPSPSCPAARRSTPAAERPGGQSQCKPTHHRPAQDTARRRSSTASSTSGPLSGLRIRSPHRRFTPSISQSASGARHEQPRG